jgi:hypothetical protein
VERAARVSKCYYVGIDHVINDGKPYIIEMNASPGSGNIYYRYYEDGKGKDNVKGEELVEDFVDYIINKAHWKLFSNLAVREKVVIDGEEYTAKIDTGNSGYNMMHAEDIKDNGDHTVTFKLPNGKKVTKKIVSRITVKSGIGEKKRLVVLMDIEFHGKKYPNIKFSLGDRSHMSTKVLIGLQFLSKTGMVVDPADAIYPQPDVNSKRKGDEEEEEELAEMIRQEGGKWVIYSKDGDKKLGSYGTENAAKKRLRQIEFFKRQTHSRISRSIGEENLAFRGKEMKSHLDGLMDKIEKKHGSTNVTYAQAMKVVGATGAARLAARGKIKRNSGEKEKGELGKQESVSEADATKGKEFKTKSGKTKESPKDKGTGLPKKYVSGLSKKEAELRKQRLAKRKKSPDDDPKTWEFVNPREKKIKTKPSKYTSLYKKLEKQGKLKALKNQYEHDDAMERLFLIDESSKTNNEKIMMAISYEERCRSKSMMEAADMVRSYINYLKEIRDQELATQAENVMSIDDDFEYLMVDSDTSSDIREFFHKEQIKKQFRESYGDSWRSVYYGTAWKNSKTNPIVPSEEWLTESKKVNATLKWTSLGKRGPLLIGTKEIVNTYKQDTPGERERLKEEKSDKEKDELYREWQKLVNMSGKEIQSFLDSDDGKVAGLSRKQAAKAGTGGKKITSGRDSARAIVRMLDTPKEKWTANDWKWAGKQVSFISRMKGAQGPSRDEKGRPTRKLLSLKVWGHNPEKSS